MTTCLIVSYYHCNTCIRSQVVFLKWKDNKSIDNLSDRLYRLEAEAGDSVVNANSQQELTLEEKFNWFVRDNTLLPGGGYAPS